MLLHIAQSKSLFVFLVVTDCRYANEHEGRGAIDKARDEPLLMDYLAIEVGI